MILVRSGGIFGFVIALLVAALFLFVVRPAINDTTERAFDTANRALDDASRQTDEIRATIEQSTSDHLSPASFATVVGQIKRELGRDAELLGVTVSAQGGNVKYRTGDSAAGYQWGRGHEGLEPVQVTLVGSGSLAENVFPIAKLDPAAAARLSAAADFDVQTMTLDIDPAGGAVRWTVTGERDGRARAVTARSDGSHLKRIR
jgi:hypothetical protein